MKRSICIVMTLLLCVAFLSVGVSAKTYHLSDTDLSIRLDDTIWYVFTRDNLDNNPELGELGISYDDMHDILYDNEAYMDAIVCYEDGDYLEMFIRKRALDNGLVNLTNYSYDRVLEMAEQLAEKQGSKTYSVYENRYKFARLEYFDSGVNCDVCEYITVINKDNYTLTFQSENGFADWEYEQMENIVDSIQFDVDPSLEEEEDGGFFGNVLTPPVGGAVIGGAVGAVVGLVNKKKKKAAQENETPPVNGPELG